MKNISQLTIVSRFESNVVDARIFTAKAQVLTRVVSGISLSRIFGEIFFYSFLTLFCLLFMEHGSEQVKEVSNGHSVNFFLTYSRPNTRARTK